MRSLSLFVGAGVCNANCSHCAGAPLRKYAPKKDGDLDEELIIKTIKKCYNNGARYLSISSSGEPTLSPKSVTKTLSIINDIGVVFNPINLYTNGIRISDANFSEEYLPLWKNMGLTTIYITVHNIDEKRNAQLYGIKTYPSLKFIIGTIKKHGLSVRANLILSKNTICSFDEFKRTTNILTEYGVDKISSWRMRDLDDGVDLENHVSKKELKKIEKWVINKSNMRLLVENSDYENNKKLTLFQNGVLSNTWCK